MLKIENAIRTEIYKSPKGYPVKLYVFERLDCKCEIKKTQYYAKKCFGFCKNCSPKNLFVKNRNIKERECRLCSKILDISEFSIRETGLPRSECKSCINIKNNYDLTSNEYNQMLIEQNYCCQICKSTFTHRHQNGKKTKLVVDHCHKTGKIRGLLCSMCNIGIGNLKENITNLMNAIEYLKKYNE